MTIELKNAELGRRAAAGAGTSFFVLVAGLASVLPSCGDTSPTDPCADVLKMKSPPATLPCPLGREAMCPYLESAGRDVQVHFTLSYQYNAPMTRDGVLDASANEQYQQCILNYLAAEGLSGSIGLYDQKRGTVSVNGTYSQVVPVASRLDVITYYDIDCSNGAPCVDCMPFNVDQCLATPICHVFWGASVDVVRGCMGAAQRLGCLPLEYEDSFKAMWRRDPQGNCWLTEITDPYPLVLQGWTDDYSCGLPGQMPFPYCSDP